MATAVVLTSAAVLLVASGTGRAQTPVHRVNAGGPKVSSTPDWLKDTKRKPSPFVNATATGNVTKKVSATIDLGDGSIPAGTPQAIFQSARIDPSAAPSLQWDLQVTSGTYTVRLYFAEIVPAFQAVGARTFDVEIEGTQVLDGYDIFAEVGAYAGTVESFDVATEGNLDIDFLPGAAGMQPMVNAIEVEPTGTLDGAWRDETNLPVNRAEVAYVEVGGEFHLFGGGTSHHIYDPATRTWSNGAPLPFKIHHIQAAVVGGKVYLLGGLTSWPGGDVGTVFVYDPDTDTIMQGTPMPAARQRGAGGVAVHGGLVYYAGGLHGGTAVRWFDAYDPVSDSWTQLPDMPTPRDHFHAAVLDGRLWAIGGRNADINAVTTANEAYDFSTGAWSTGYAPLPTPRGGFAAVALDGRIFVIGGEGFGQTWPNVEAFTPPPAGSGEPGVWQAFAQMPNPRHGIQGAVCNGGIYIAGGASDQGGGNAVNTHDALFPAGTPTSCTG